MSDTPYVTVLIPARNEDADIERCLQHVLAQDHPHDRMEIVLVDGGSSDRTSAVAEDVLGSGDVAWRIVENSAGTTPSNLNAGLVAASGDILCRVDARSLIPPDYVRLCAEVLQSRSDVVVTGGAQVAIARDSSSAAVGIARALNNRYAMGGSRYRSGGASGPSDTVYLGAFRTAELRAAGGWDEYFETNQDFELNRRMGRTGVVWFDGRLTVGYLPRQSLVALIRQYHRFGRWKVRYWRRTGESPLPRQVGLLGLFAGGVLVAVAIALKGGARSILLGVGVGASGLIAVDHVGVRKAARPLERVVGGASAAAVGTSWTFGVVAGLLRRAGER